MIRVRVHTDLHLFGGAQPLRGSLSFHQAGPFRMVADAAAFGMLRSLKTLLARATQIDSMDAAADLRIRVEWAEDLSDPCRVAAAEHIRVGSRVGKRV